MRQSALLLLLLSTTVLAEIQQSPAAASTRLYFAQLADGGPAAQKWTTTFILVNPGTVAATAAFQFTGDTGQPLNLDFGQGARSTHTVSLEPGAASTFTSTGSSDATVIGWASMAANTPLIGNVLYRATQNAAPVSEVAAPGAGSTYYYNSWVTTLSGIALANPNAYTIHLNVALKDLAGKAVTSQIITLNANAHTAFNLASRIPGVPSNFSGSMAITTADSAPVAFIAWVLNVRENLLAPLPQGETRSPSPPDRRAYDAYARVRAAVRPLLDTLGKDPRNFTKISKQQILDLLGQIQLVVDSDTFLKATYQKSDKTIHISPLMLEMLGDSESALAFLLARQAGKGILVETGLPPTGSTSTDPDGV
ncbi:MAG: hypothetical protein NTY38_04200, partial [Acidobacteria bacterium]|nr:hypothetical protein [Acidobacteriota bacterium]